MPKLRKEDTEDLDIEELEAADYTEGGNYSTYDGEVPPKDTILTAFVKAMWWTRTGGGDPMLKVLVEAAENEGELEEYNGLPAWENMALTTGAKFKWAPFMSHFGFTLRDVKNKTTVAEKDDNVGAPIEKIGTFVPGSDESWCRIITSRERYNDVWQAHVAEWLDYEEGEEPEEADEPEEEEEELEEDEEIEDEVEEEEEPEPEPPARGRRAPAKSAAKPAARQAAKPAATARKAPAATPARSTSRRSAPAASAPAKATATAAPRRGRRAAAATDDPPF